MAWPVLVFPLLCCFARPAMMEWYPNWEKNNWKGANGQCIKNLDEFKRLKELSTQVEINWVRLFGDNNFCNYACVWTHPPGTDQHGRENIAGNDSHDHLPQAKYSPPSIIQTSQDQGNAQIIESLDNRGYE